MNNLLQKLLKKINLFIDKKPVLVRCRNGLLTALEMTKDDMLRKDCKKYLAMCTRKDKVAEHLIKNAIRYRNEVGEIVGVQMIDLTVAILNKLSLDKILGVQALPEPLGNVFVLTLTDGEPNKTITGESDIQQLSLKIEKIVANAKTRKFHSRFSPEKQLSELEKFHEVNMSKELVNIMSDCIVEEIEREFTHRMQMLAKPISMEDVPQTDVAQAIRFASIQIGMTTKRGTGNFAILSPYALSILQNDASFVRIESTDNQVGILDGQIRIYSGYYTDYDAIVGFKGSGEMDAGLFYCPHRLVFTGGVVIDPNTFNPCVNLLTRYDAVEHPNVENYFRKFNIKK